MLPGALLYRGTVHASRGDGGNTPPLTVWNQTWFQGQTLLHRSPCYTTSPAPVSTFWLVRVVGCVPLLAVLAPVFHPAQPTYLPHKPQHGVQWVSPLPPSPSGLVPLLSYAPFPPAPSVRPRVLRRPLECAGWSGLGLSRLLWLSRLVRTVGTSPTWVSPFPTSVGPSARSWLQFSWCDIAELHYRVHGCDGRPTGFRNVSRKSTVVCLSRLTAPAYISLPVVAPSRLVILVLLMMGSQHGLAVVAPVACSPAPTAASVAGSWGWLCESRKTV